MGATIKLALISNQIIMVLWVGGDDEPGKLSEMFADIVSVPYACLLILVSSFADKRRTYCSTFYTYNGNISLRRKSRKQAQRL